MEHANTIWFMSRFVKVIHSFINHPEIWWQHFQEFCILSTSFVLWVVTRLTNFVIILDGRINHFKKMTTTVSVSPDYWTFGSTRSKYELVKSKKPLIKSQLLSCYNCSCIKLKAKKVLILENCEPFWTNFWT